MKICTWCNESKEETEFKYRRDRDYWYPYCKLCERTHENSLNKERYKKNPQKYRDRSITAYHSDPDKYRLNRQICGVAKITGLSKDTVRTYLESRKEVSVCDICNKECPSGMALGVDHCHETGEIRGLLCCNCNRALGLFKDSINSLKQAIAYLEKEI